MCYQDTDWYLTLDVNNTVCGDHLVLPVERVRWSDVHGTGALGSNLNEHLALWLYRISAGAWEGTVSTPASLFSK